MEKKQVIILGGGLAGLASAVPLAEEGLQVTILERRPFLGGRAASYPVPKADRQSTDDLSSQSLKDFQPHSGAPALSPYADREFVDNCQHVLLRCCTNLLDFYRRLDVDRHIAFQDRYLFLDEQGREAVLRSSRLPAPLHLLPSFIRFTPLGWKDKFAVAYALLCMLREQGRLQELDQITMLRWLQERHQTPRVIESFWRVVLVSALNEKIEVASARYGVKVFLDGMLRNREAFRMGVPAVPLSRLYTEPSLRFLDAYHCAVQLRKSAARIEIGRGRVESVLLADGTTVTGDYYVSTLPPEGFLKLLPEELRQSGSEFEKLQQFECSPITAIYLWFDREVTSFDNAALLGKDIQWIFNKPGGREQGNTYVGLVVSASEKLLPLSRNQILEIALHDLRDVLPKMHSARLLGSVVIKEPFATFSCRAGCDKIRPDQKSPLSNLFIAGDWTNTGWPPTMEGAVRSGYRCAELILRAEGREVQIQKPDLPAEWLARWISKW